jgi:hypothetical protein
VGRQGEKARGVASPVAVVLSPCSRNCRPSTLVVVEIIRDCTRTDSKRCTLGNERRNENSVIRGLPRARYSQGFLLGTG